MELTKRPIEPVRIMPAKGKLMQRSVEGLHVIVNSQVPPYILDQIILGKPAVIQFREKVQNGLSLEEIAEQASKMQQRLAGSGILFAVNDHVQLAVASRADIVHVGQSDMSGNKVAKRVTPDMIFGVSVDTIDQAFEAQKNGASYVGVAYENSKFTKPDVKVVGPKVLQDISQVIDIPVIAIGGITLSNAARVMNHGSRGFAVAGEVIRSSDPYKCVLALKQIIYQYKKSR